MRITLQIIASLLTQNYHKHDSEISAIIVQMFVWTLCNIMVKTNMIFIHNNGTYRHNFRSYVRQFSDTWSWWVGLLQLYKTIKHTMTFLFTPDGKSEVL